MILNRTTALFLLFPSFASGATTLAAGDLAFLGHNLDGNDAYAFVLLKDVDSTTTINFTDRGWNDTGGFFTSAGDGDWSWTSGSNRSAGTVITIAANNPGLSASLGMTSATTSPVFSGLGDQVFAYQGDGSLSTLIAGIHSNEAPVASGDANWSGAATNNQTSALPDTFTNGDQAIRLHNGGGELDNWRYNSTSASSLTGTPAEIRAQLHNIANWSSSNSTPNALASADFGTFNVITVPEPSSIFLVAVATLGATGFRRRK